MGRDGQHTGTRRDRADVYDDDLHGPRGWKRTHRRPALRGLTGFFGAVYRKGGTLVIAFRGSEGFNDDFIRDWLVNDVAILSKRIPIPQAVEAGSFARDAVEAAGRKSVVYITGHSLGGALAQIVAGNLDGTIGVTFNAPGVRDRALSALRSWSNAAKVLNLRAEGDPVSKFGDHVGSEPVTLRNSNAPTLAGTAVKVYASMTLGLAIGLKSRNAGVAVGMAAASAGAAVGEAVKHVAQAHTMDAVLACLRNNPIARKTPELLLA